MVHELKGSVNPLVYTIKLRWPQAVSGKISMNIWNLFEIWAAKNDVVPQGKVLQEHEGKELLISLATKRRLGPPKIEEP